MRAIADTRRVLHIEPRPACPGWTKIRPEDRPPELAGRPEPLLGCGRRQAVIVARRGSRTTPAWRLHCLACDRWFWTRTPGAAAYPGASVARALGWEDAARAALAGWHGRPLMYDEARYHHPGESRGGEA